MHGCHAVGFPGFFGLPQSLLRSAQFIPGFRALGLGLDPLLADFVQSGPVIVQMGQGDLHEEWLLIISQLPECLAGNHADQLSLSIKQRAAAGSEAETGVGADDVAGIKRVKRFHLAAGGHRRGAAAGMPDGNDFIAFAQAGSVAQRHRRERKPVDGEQTKVMARVGLYRLDWVSVLGLRYPCLGRAAEHMAIGDHLVFADHHAGTVSQTAALIVSAHQNHREKDFHQVLLIKREAVLNEHQATGGHEQSAHVFILSE